MSIKISTIVRYPVKGLSPELLEKVRLSSAQCIPYDRRFALARASTLFDPQHPEWLPKTNFYMLMRDETLADIASHPPRDQADLAKVRGLSSGWRENDIGRRLMQTIADAKALTESFFSQLGPNSNFGSQFAQTVTVKCGDAHL